jgi:hypothetical protein
MQHRMMLGIKQRAEGSRNPRAADVLVPVSWFAATAVAALHAARALRCGGLAAPQESALASLAAVAVELVLFWDLPAPVRNREIVMRWRWRQIMLSEDFKTHAEHLVDTRSVRLGAWLLTSVKDCSATWWEVEVTTKGTPVSEHRNRAQKRWT